MVREWSVCELSSPRVDQPANRLTVRRFVGEFVTFCLTMYTETNRKLQGINLLQKMTRDIVNVDIVYGL